MAGSYSARSALMAPLHWPTLPPPRTSVHGHWYMEGKINIDDLITHRMPLEEINTAFDLMHDGSRSGRS